MGTPKFVVDLRKSVGTDLLVLVGVVGIIHDGFHNILLNKRSDTLEWAPIMGVIEPGEQPAAALLRELQEETNVAARIDGLAGVIAQPVTSYINGDIVQFTDLIFTGVYISGDTRVNDDESVDVNWFPAGCLPSMSDQNTERLRIASSFYGVTHFRTE